jgi:hypothetical protein
MSDPNVCCPTCAIPLCSFERRLCCDACDGIMLEATALEAAIVALTGIVPTLEFCGELGSIDCPLCHAAMARCSLRLGMGSRHLSVAGHLDRCAEHGLWFDSNQLARVFSVCRRPAYLNQLTSQ